MRHSGKASMIIVIVLMGVLSVLAGCSGYEGIVREPCEIVNEICTITGSEGPFTLYKARPEIDQERLQDLLDELEASIEKGR